MKTTLRFLPEVEDDALAGYLWYEEKAVGLGEDFLRMFYACTDGLVRKSKLYALGFGDYRRCLVRRFPYAVYYRIEDDTVLVIGLFHCARDPIGLRSILASRTVDDSH